MISCTSRCKLWVSWESKLNNGLARTLCVFTHRQSADYRNKGKKTSTEKCPILRNCLFLQLFIASYRRRKEGKYIPIVMNKITHSKDVKNDTQDNKISFSMLMFSFSLFIENIHLSNFTDFSNMKPNCRTVSTFLHIYSIKQFLCLTLLSKCPEIDTIYLPRIKHDFFYCG